MPFISYWKWKREIVGFIGARTTEGTDLLYTNVNTTRLSFYKCSYIIVKSNWKFSKSPLWKEINPWSSSIKYQSGSVEQKEFCLCECYGNEGKLPYPENDAVEMLLLHYHQKRHLPSILSEYSFTRLQPVGFSDGWGISWVSAGETDEHPNHWASRVSLIWESSKHVHGVWMQRH